MLLPPLVHTLRQVVKKWRNQNYDGASDTSNALLRWWFQTNHPVETTDGTVYFKYYFAQREAIETIIYLYEVAKVKSVYDLSRYDCSEVIRSTTFAEDWLRFVIKMATGSGKTKVMSLLVAWSYFHKMYEHDSKLSRNFLLITPNIIVLDRVKADFEASKIFFTDPILPDNGFERQNWREDFQMSVHLQDKVNTFSKTGNIFLTNIHRIYKSNKNRLVTKTSDSKVDLGETVRDIGELMVLNDEAHHVHDDDLVWFRSIKGINEQMKLKGKSLSLQIDVTATPKHAEGSIFVQTVSDYPLIEAIHQNVVKRPIVPDLESRKKLLVRESSKFAEKYKDYIHLGFLEWKKSYETHEELGKKAVLFVMTDDTKNCDNVAEYLQNTYSEFRGAVLTIHTNRSGEILETVTGKKKEELTKLRKAANEIDSPKSKYKVIVSVLMLKEGWDVKNVTTIVGLRPYSSKSNILPEQTLGRGLRRMYGTLGVNEYVSVIGTEAFMNFVERIKSEGIELEYVKMDKDTKLNAPLLIKVDRGNVKKDIQKLDIQIPILTPRIYREYKNIPELDVVNFKHKKLRVQKFSKKEKEEIVFRDITTGEKDHTMYFDSSFMPNYQGIVCYFVKTIRNELRFDGMHDILYGKVKEFIINFLFVQIVDLEDPNILRNLSRLEATKTIIETFKKEINSLSVVDRGEAEVKEYRVVSTSKKFMVNETEFFEPEKSVFNRIVGDSKFELQFARFLEECDDIISYTKNYRSIHFKIDYRNADGDIKNYYPDFVVKASENDIYIIETKGREDLDDIRKKQRLYQWITDINSEQNEKNYTALYVKQINYDKYLPGNFGELVACSVNNHE